MKYVKYLIIFVIIFISIFIICKNWKKNYINRTTEEIIRETSPDGIVDAFITKNGGGGATVGFTYTVFIVPKGEKDDKYDSPVLLCDKIKNLKIAWKEPKLLIISYEKARIFDFKNFWGIKEVDNFTYEVEIQLNGNGDKKYLYPFPKFE